jgi:hypothetical protein
MVDLDYVVNTIIPHRLGAIDRLTHALRLRNSFGEPKPIEIYFDRKLTIVGNSNAYTNPVIVVGIDTLPRTTGVLRDMLYKKWFRNN